MSCLKNSHPEPLDELAVSQTWQPVRVTIPLLQIENLMI
jgi:hypothetical protein